LILPSGHMSTACFILLHRMRVLLICYRAASSWIEAGGRCEATSTMEAQSGSRKHLALMTTTLPIGLLSRTTLTPSSSRPRLPLLFSFPFQHLTRLAHRLSRRSPLFLNFLPFFTLFALEVFLCFLLCIHSQKLTFVNDM
jgi:hypothetical protein